MSGHSLPAVNALSAGANASRGASAVPGPAFFIAAQDMLA
ncbi:hypothetical protein BUUB107078_28415 [Burkholderia ubonensis]|nr:hypothetical protein BUB20358_04100 [Burkholderia ubonensis]